MCFFFVGSSASFISYCNNTFLLPDPGFKLRGFDLFPSLSCPHPSSFVSPIHRPLPPSSPASYFQCYSHWVDHQALPNHWQPPPFHLQVVGPSPPHFPGGQHGVRAEEQQRDPGAGHLTERAHGGGGVQQIPGGHRAGQAGEAGADHVTGGRREGEELECFCGGRGAVHRLLW